MISMTTKELIEALRKEDPEEKQTVIFGGNRLITDVTSFAGKVELHSREVLTVAAKDSFPGSSWRG